MSGNQTISAPLSSLPAKPNFTDAMNALRKDTFLNLYAHHIGTIQSVDYDTQTATAQINYTKTYYQINNNPGPTYGTYTPVQKQYPPITGPLVFLGGGGSFLTFPVAPGDECLCLFNDRDFSNWFNGNSNAPPASARLHSPSDAVILVGIRSLSNVITEEGSNNFQTILKGPGNEGANNAYILLTSTKITLARAGLNLNGLLQSLISTIEAITTVNSDSTTGVLSPTSIAALQNVATQIGELLD